MLESNYNYLCDKNEWYAINKNNISRNIKVENSFTLRVEGFVWIFDNRYMSVIKNLAETLHNILEPEKEVVPPAEMITRPEGRDFGMQDYVD